MQAGSLPTELSGTTADCLLILTSREIQAALALFLLISMSAELCPVFSAPKTLVSAMSSEQLGRGGRELNLRASPVRLLKVCSLPRLAWAQEHPGCPGEWGARRDPWLRGAHPSLGSEQGSVLACGSRQTPSGPLARVSRNTVFFRNGIFKAQNVVLCNEKSV